MTEGVHIATPGALSRWGVIDVGLKCMHSCEFCYYSWLGNEPGQFAGMRKAPFAPREHLLDMTRGLKANGFIGFDVTGGEPCLHPDIVALVAEASRLGLASRVITLGQYLMRPMKSVPEHKTLLGGLLSAGLTDLLLSVHAVDEDSFREITGESWAKL
ncbi:MAG TPA: radical SAM protein, partial [Stellaceae bacterium]|nr:radical SAM protein [Stellaceae bacterium]